MKRPSPSVAKPPRSVKPPRAPAPRPPVKRDTLIKYLKAHPKSPSRGLATLPRAIATRIHRAGGLAVSADREHMREIGRLGGSRRKGYRKPVVDNT